MLQLVEFLARNLVDRPEEVRVRERDEESGTVLEISVAPEDVGKIIGRQGRVIQAIRVLARAATSKSTGKRLSVEVIRSPQRDL